MLAHPVHSKTIIAPSGVKWPLGKCCEVIVIHPFFTHTLDECHVNAGGHAKHASAYSATSVALWVQ